MIITWFRNNMIHILESSTIGDLMFKFLGEDKKKGVTTISVP
jgi:glycerol-3-phosphate O-acyltransferase